MLSERDSKRIRRNKAFLHALERRIEWESDLIEKVRLCKVAASFASAYHPGCFFSSTVENALADVAARLKTKPPQGREKPMSYLHVMTEAYIAGGHTRVVERWIEKCPIEQTHSLVLTAQGIEPLPKRLEKAVLSKNGEIILLSGNDDLEKGLSLRQIAGGYERIILHIHPNDILALLAFGTDDFKRPVILYNHADHVFWIGLAIADMIADLSTKGQQVSVDRRNASNTFILPVPLDPPGQLLAKSEARKRLNLPENLKIVLSIGASYKYSPSRTMDFPQTAVNLTRRFKDLVCLVIGPNDREEMWAEAARQSSGRIKVLGPVPHSDLVPYIVASDLYMDSFPVGSGTTVLEVALYGIPVLSVDNGFTQFDSYKPVIVPYQNLLSAALTLLEGGQAYDQQRLMQAIRETHCDAGWLRNLDELLKKTPALHSVRHIPQMVTPVDDYDGHIEDVLRRIRESVTPLASAKPALKLRNKIFITYNLLKYRLLSKRLAIAALNLGYWKYRFRYLFFRTLE